MIGCVKRSAISLRARFNIIVILGFLFCTLIIHNLYIFKFRLLVSQGSLKEVLGSLPIDPAIALGVAFVIFVVVVVVLVTVNRKIPEDTASTVRWLSNGPISLLGVALLVTGFSPGVSRAGST